MAPLTTTAGFRPFGSVVAAALVIGSGRRLVKKQWGDFVLDVRAVPLIAWTGLVPRTRRLMRTRLFLATLAVVMFLSVFWNAPLEELANPTHPPNPAKAPWYFLGLQELVSYSAFWGGVVVPAVLLVALVVLPYLDRKRAGVGVWFARERRVAVTIFTICVVATVVFTVIGTYFRGPNWGWVWPWAEAATTSH